MVGGTLPWQPRACFPLESCPSACPADAILEDEVLPKLYELSPNFEIQSAQALCREDNPETGECCYIGLVQGINPDDGA